MQNTQKLTSGFEESAPHAKERLDSWKEIASFFGRQVRTVQLWEKSEGLPVRRQHHKKLGSVYAYRRDLDAWWTARSRIRTADPSSDQSTSLRIAEDKPFDAPSQSERLGSMRILALPVEILRSPSDREESRTAVEQFACGLKSDLVVELTRSQFHPVVLPLEAIPLQAASPMAWANEIAAELEVDVILSGSIRYLGSRLRISMQLVRASDMLCLWSDRFDSKLDNTFDAQAELARRISQALPNCQLQCKKQHGHAVSANSGLAHHACSLGFHSWQQRGSVALTKAVHYFNDAVELDPRCAEAHAGIADTYISLSYSHLMPARQAASRAWKAAQTALHLNAQSIKANNAYINTLIHCNWDLRTAEQRCREMIDAGRFDARTMQLYSSIMILRDRHLDSIRLALRACELAPEPDQVHLNGQVSLAYFYAGDYGNAVSFIRRTVDRQPLHMMGYVLLGRAEAQRGNWDEAIYAFKKGIELSQGSSFNKALLAYAYAASGDSARADAMLKNLSAERDKETFPAYDISAAYAALNHEREALEYMRTAVDRRDMMALFVRQDPRFNRLQTSSGFQQITSSIDVGSFAVTA